LSARPPRFPAALGRIGTAPSAADPQRPQRLLAQAADDARRRQPPSGLGLDSSGVRARMVQRLRDDGLRNEAVLAAFAAVPRHAFVDTALAAQAYEDTALPIGHGQTISKPSVVARMLELLFDGRNARASGTLGRALEIGTGCGYQAALLCELARSVVSIERLRPLHEGARQRLRELPRDNLRLVFADGRLGHAPNAPYDSIVAAAGGDDLPQPWLEQLAVGGRLVAPLRAGDAGQVLVVVDRDDAGWQRRHHEGVRFVPLESGLG
jgi:protein-L-isoaspartate(D-aspartate) O-methyltransferase